MAEPFLGQITITAFEFAPRHYALCDGGLLSISQNQALYSLLGTTYGGDGRTTFSLPDLQGRVPIHKSHDRPMGMRAGESVHTLTFSEMPSHSHNATAREEPGTQPAAAQAVPAVASLPAYGTGQEVRMANTVTREGGGQPHDNMQPYGVISYCIALQGLFPSRS